MDLDTVVSLSSLVSVGVLVALLIRWLTSRRLAVARFTGGAIAVIVVLYCAVVVFALNAGSVGEPKKLPGVLPILAFTMTGAAALAGAIGGIFPPKSRP